MTLSWESGGVTGSETQVQWNGSPDFSATGVGSATAEFRPGSRSFTVTGLDPARTWWFRLRDSNAAGDSEWTAPVPCLVATVPDAPAVAPLQASYAAGDALALSWQHASADGAAQDAYEIELTANGSASTLSGAAESSRSVPLSGYAGGAAVSVRVRTHSAGGWSPWSAAQAFAVFAPVDASASLSAGGRPVGPSDPLGSLPLRVAAGGAPYPEGNAPIWWRVVIAAVRAYEAVGPDGSRIAVAEGQALVDWSIAAGDEGFPEGALAVDVGAAAMSFAQGALYEARVECETEAGLRSSSEPVRFEAMLSGTVPQPGASLEWDAAAMAVTVRPVCGWWDDGEAAPSYREGVELSVYRLSQDGEAALVASGLPNDGTAACADFRADFGSSSYRVVARDPSTGAQASADFEVETPMPLAVVLWDESERLLDAYGDPLPYMGRALSGIYNSVPEESYSKDTAYREHAGAAHPVARRGTQRGHKVRLSFDMAAGSGDDRLLRQLEAHDGDCYVRIPGFPADARVESIGKSYESPGRVSASVEFTHVLGGGAAARGSGSGVEVAS